MIGGYRSSPAGGTYATSNHPCQGACPRGGSDPPIRRITDEASNRGRLAIIDEALTAEYLGHQAGLNVPRGPEGCTRFVGAVRATFPDLSGTIQDLITQGGPRRPAVTWRGSQLGTLGGVPPSALAVEFAGFHVDRFDNGKVAEHRGLQDDLVLLLQLGVVAPGAVPPTPGVTARA